MPLEISYHIVDFKVDDNIKILELGNAFYGSNLSERSAVFNNNEAMLKHAALYGTVKIKTPVYRSFRHFSANSEMDSEPYAFLKEQTGPSSPEIIVVDDALLMLSAGMEYIQELHDAFMAEGSNDRIVFDGTIDTFYLCDRNKRIFNKILELNNLQQFQPETWCYDPGSPEPFIPPVDIPYFVIKPMKESMGKGVMLVANQDVLPLLEALKTGSEFPQKVGDRDYYLRSQNKQVLIQRFYPGKLLEYNSLFYRPTARAVFAVVKKDDALSVDILDIFWNLPEKPAYDRIPAASDSISYGGHSSEVRSQVSLEKNDYEQMEKVLKEKLLAVSSSIYNQDIKGYLLKLQETKQLDEISYYLDIYSHVRVARLDEEFISLILSVDEKKARAFLVGQAMDFALPWHLNYKNICLKTWVEVNLAQLEPRLLKDLLDFFKNNKQTITGSGTKDKEIIIREYDFFINRIIDILAAVEKVQEIRVENTGFKQNATQTFFKKPAEVTKAIVTTDLTYG